MDPWTSRYMLSRLIGESLLTIQEAADTANAMHQRYIARNLGDILFELVELRRQALELPPRLTPARSEEPTEDVPF